MCTPFALCPLTLTLSWRAAAELKYTSPGGAGTHGSEPAAAALFDHVRVTV
jgi:hypothetical protein